MTLASVYIYRLHGVLLLPNENCQVINLPDDW